MHIDLINALQTLGGLPGNQTPKSAYKALGLDKNFSKLSFWWALKRSLPYANSENRQIEIANWIFARKERAERAGRVWPEKQIISNRLFSQQIPHNE